MSSASAALSVPFITSRAGARLGEPNNVAAIAATISVLIICAFSCSMASWMDGACAQPGRNTMNALWRASEMFVTRVARRILVANPMTKPSTISFDGWTLHRDSGELERDGKRVRLQDLPFQILDELLGRPGEVVTREQLIARLWPKTIVDFDTNLNSGVRRLRAALKDDADAPRYVETLPRRGYRYLGPLPRENVAVDPAAAPEGPPVIAPPPETDSRASRTAPLLWLGVLVALLIAAFCGIPLETGGGATIVRSEPRRRHLDASAPGGTAVRKPEPRSCQRLLHRWNARRDPQHDRQPGEQPRSDFAHHHDGVSRDAEIRARDRQGIERDACARRLGAPRGTNRASHAAAHRCAQRRAPVVEELRSAVSDAMALQSAIAQEVSAQLAVRLSGNIAELPAPASPEAYDLYLKARLAMQTIYARRSAREQARALDLLDRAIALDGEFAAAYLQRARVRMDKFTGSQDVSESNLAAAARRSRRRPQDDGRLAAVAGDGSRLCAARRFRRRKGAAIVGTAATSESEQLGGLSLSGALTEQRRPRRGSASHYQRAAELDPGNPTIAGDWARISRWRDMWRKPFAGRANSKRVIPA